jgi:O-methyltransferase
VDNLFLTEYFDWKPQRPTIVHKVINRALRALHIRHRIGPYSGLMTSVEQRMNIFHLAMQVLVYDVPGAVVELGCHAGQTALLIQKVIQCYAPDRRLHVYDSFEGLPDKSTEDGRTPFSKGWLSTTEDRLKRTFEEHGLPLPTIHRGWFEETLPTALPETIAFAHLDGDFYRSILVSLEHVYPRMSTNAVCIVDDYFDPVTSPHGWNALPGVKRACDEFFADKPERMYALYAGPYAHGFFRKGESYAAADPVMAKDKRQPAAR